MKRSTLRHAEKRMIDTFRRGIVNMPNSLDFFKENSVKRTRY